MKSVETIPDNQGRPGRCSDGSSYILKFVLVSFSGSPERVLPGESSSSDARLVRIRNYYH